MPFGPFSTAIRQAAKSAGGMQNLERDWVQSPRIAVVGFGSLIWRQRSRSGKLKLSSKWHTDGPPLPVEYARISDNGRLTLVIVPGTEPQRTLWAYSACTTLEDARENLRKREGKAVRIDRIGAWQAGSNMAGDATRRTISRWAEAKRLPGVVWTDLRPKDEHGDEVAMPKAEALRYLSGLKGYKRRVAREYIIKTPRQINTEVRKLARERLGWADYPLPPDLFED